MDTRERKIVTLTSIVHALVHMQMLIFAAVNLPMAQDLGVSVEQIGFIGTIGYFLFGFGALPAGFIIDRIGARKVIVLCTVGMGIADLLIAFAPGTMWAIVGLGTLGIAGSLYHPAGLGLISRNVRETGHALGIHGTIGNFGVAGGPLVAGLVASLVSWRAAYIWPVVPMAILAFIYFTTRFGDVGEDMKHLEPQPDRKFTFPALRILILVIILQAVSGFIYRASNTFMPAYTGQALREFFASLDVTARGGIMTGIILIAGSVGQYISGRLTRRYPTETLQLFSAAVATPLLAGVGLLSGGSLLASAMAFSFVFYGLQPLGNALVAKYSPPALRGRSYGVSFFLNFGLGAFGSGVAGSIAYRQSYSAIYVWLAVLSCVSIVVAALVYFFHRRRERATAAAVTS